MMWGAAGRAREIAAVACGDGGAGQAHTHAGMR